MPPKPKRAKNTKDAIPATQTSNKPRNKARGSGRGKGRGRRQTQTDSAEVISIDRSTPQAENGSNNTTGTRGRGGRRGAGTGRGSINGTSQRAQRRATVISLDVTYSSSDLDVSEEENPEDEYIPDSPIKSMQTSNPFNNTFSPDQIAQRGLLSDSDSDEASLPIVRTPSAKKGLRKTKPKYDETFDSDSDVDLYAVNFEKHKKKIAEEVKSVKLADIDLTSDEDDLLDKVKQNVNSSRIDDDSDDNYEQDLSALLTDVKTPNNSRSRIRMKKSTRALMNKMNKNKNQKSAVTEEDSDIEVISDEDSTDVTIRVQWMGQKINRVIMKKTDTFSKVFQNLAHKYGVSVKDVYLSFKERKITPDDCPENFSLSIVDIIEGGIIAPTAPSRSSPRKNKDPNILTLKVQNANRKENVSIQIHKLDKMSILMCKYSELKKIPLSKLKFKFDGEDLAESDTAESLDLEGGECIDVYEK